MPRGRESTGVQVGRQDAYGDGIGAAVVEHAALRSREGEREVAVGPDADHGSRDGDGLCKRSNSGGGARSRGARGGAVEGSGERD